MDFEKIDVGAARTNILKITNDIETTLHLLLDNSGNEFSVTYGIKESDRRKGESKTAYYKRFDREIRESIQRELDLPFSSEVRYSRTHIRAGKAIYFYLGLEQRGSPALVDYIDRFGFQMRQVVECLLKLRVKLNYIENMDTSGVLLPVLMNNEFLIGAFVSFEKDDYIAVDVLEPVIFVSEFLEVCVELHKSVYRCPKDSYVFDSKNGRMLFHGKFEGFDSADKINATKYSDRPYMSFQGRKHDFEVKKLPKRYDRSVNYHQNNLMNNIESVLNELEISFDRVLFKPNTLSDRVNDFQFEHKLPFVIISNLKSKSASKEFVETLKNDFEELKDAQVVYNYDQDSIGQNIDRSSNFIVLNEVDGKSGTSIFSKKKNTYLNSFENVLSEVDLSDEDSFIDKYDPYTALKLECINSGERFSIQGVDIDYSSKKSEGGYKQPSGHVINKCLTELYFKESAFIFKSIETAYVGEADLDCFLVRRVRDDENKGSFSTFIAKVVVCISGSNLAVNDFKVYSDDDEGRFNFEYEKYEFLGQKSDEGLFSSLRNGQFFIIDKNTGQCLSAYHTIRVPNIIGNSGFDNVQRFREVGMSKSVKDFDNAVLPFYVRLKSLKRKVLIEGRGDEGCLIFNGLDNPNETLPKQLNVKNVLVHDKNGTRIDPLKSDLFNTFISMFVFNGIKKNELAQKTLLEKIADLHISN